MTRLAEMAGQYARNEMSEEDVADYVMALEWRVRYLETAHEPMAAAVVAAYEFIRRECAEANPETGEIVDAGALPTWHLVCEGYAYAHAAVDAEAAR